LLGFYTFKPLRLALTRSLELGAMARVSCPSTRSALARLSVALSLAAAVLVLPACPAPSSTKLVVRHSAIAAEPEGAEPRAPGGVVLLTTLELEGDHAAFGGLSGLELGPDGKTLYVVSDRGHWLKVRLRLAADGRLEGFDGWCLAPLLDTRGTPVKKSLRDAESISRLSGGGWLVGFEWEHRIWRYDSLDGPARPFTSPTGLEGAPGNGGLESLTVLQDGRVLAISEHYRQTDLNLRGWLLQDGSWHDVSYVTGGDYVPTDLAIIEPSGDVFVLERAFVPVLGNRVRIRRIEAGRIVPGARLDPPEIASFGPPLTVDNFEGLAAARHPATGATLLYLVSDDNFSGTQRTLLYQLQLAGDS
jgi:hypothetical protein